MTRLLVCMGALALLGCDPDHQSIDLERMIDQHRFDEYEPSSYFANGTIMQRPPAGTVARSARMEPLPVRLGIEEGNQTPEIPAVPGAPPMTVVETRYVARVPLAVTAELLGRGQNRYNIFCAPCHGVLGDGDTKVAENMRLRRPRSLHDPAVRGYPAGRLFRVIGEGYGLMPSYAAELEIMDRWAVVAYVQALQLSQNTLLADLPGALREEARPWLP